MPKCIQIRKPQKQVCSGDMRDRIIIQVRSITPPNASGVDYSETFSQDATVWSLCETKMGVEIFDGTAIKGVATHYFYIRWIDNLTFESWVQFKGKKYYIIDVQNLDERDEFMLLRCSERGIITNPASFA